MSLTSRLKNLSLPWTSFERRWRDTVLGAIIPGRGDLPGLDDTDTESFWRACTEASPPLLAFGLRGGVWLLIFSPPVAIGKPKLFTQLSGADRDRVLERFHQSPLYLARQVAVMLQLIGCFAYLNNPSVRHQVDPSLEK